MQRKVGLLLCLGSLIAISVYLGCGKSARDNTNDTIPVDQAVMDNVAALVTDPNLTGLTVDDSQGDVAAVTQPLETDVGSAEQGVTQPLCHPGLFARTEELVRLINRHFYKALRHTVAIISAHATRAAQNNTQFIWVRTKTFGGSAGPDGGTLPTNQVTIRITLTKNSATSYDFKMEWKNASDPDTAYVQVLGGHLDALQNAPRQGSGNMTIDLTKMAQYDPAEKAGGSIQANFKNVDTKHYVGVTFTAVVFDNDPNRIPRTGNFVHARLKGVGGSNKYQDTLNLYCGSPNAPASLWTVNRWRVNGSTHTGRSDAQATGGGLVADSQCSSAYTWKGMTCHSYTGTLTGLPINAEGIWQIAKICNQTGSAVYLDSAGTLASCDQAFGTCVQGNNCPYFDFTTISMTDANPVPFPGSAGVTFWP